MAIDGILNLKENTLLTALSVIVPTCNRGSALLQCLERILEATAKVESVTCVEIIVTDDGDLQETQKNILSVLDRVQLFQGPQKGPAFNRNFGASRAKNEWLVFIDDDCVPSSDILSAYLQALKDYKEIEAFEGKIVSSQKLTSPLEFSPVNLEGGAFWSCNIMVKKTLFERLKGFDTQYPFPAMEDIDLKERILKEGYTIVFVPNAWVDHPPRVDRTPYKNAQKHESIYYYYLKNDKKQFLLDVSRSILEDLYQRIKKYTFHPHIVSKVYYSLSEIVYVLMLYPKWKQKYKSRTGIK